MWRGVIESLGDVAALLDDVGLHGNRRACRSAELDAVILPEGTEKMDDCLATFEQSKGLKEIADLIEEIKNIRRYYNTQQYSLKN